MKRNSLMPIVFNLIFLRMDFTLEKMISEKFIDLNVRIVKNNAAPEQF